MHSIFEQKTPKNKQKISKALPQDAVPSFIRKTYEILEENKFPEYIDWNPEGTAIVIKMPSEFSQKVLPTYFKHNNLTSFVRQLNMYNFHKKRTQNLDHVYFHELFRRDQKHLLKEIKRKNHEAMAQANERSPGSYHHQSQPMMEMFNDGQTSGDLSSLSCENAFLKRLYNEAMTKASSLEAQVKELTLYNQNLWTELCQLKGQQPYVKREVSTGTYHSDRSSIANEGGLSEITFENLPMTCNEVSIPPLKLRKASNDPHLNNNCSVNNGPFVKNYNSNVNNYLTFTEDSTNQSELSYFSGSPSLQNHIESDKEIESANLPHVIPKLNQAGIASSNPFQESNNSYKNNNPLKVTRREISVGQMFAEWDAEGQENNLISFSERKENVDTNVINRGILGKRALESESNGQFGVPEPSMKRSGFDQLNVFGRKELATIGADDKDILQFVNRRESEINEDYDSNTNIDLMDFNNNNLYGWTKTM